VDFGEADSEADGVLEDEVTTEEASIEEFLISDFVEEDSLDKCEEDRKCLVPIPPFGADSEVELDLEDFHLLVTKILRCKLLLSLEWFSSNLLL